MENIVLVAIAALSAFALLKLLAVPMRLGLRLALRGLCGFVCLWLLKTGGLGLHINPVTVALSAFLGLPGIALAALLLLL